MKKAVKKPVAHRSSLPIRRLAHPGIRLLKGEHIKGAIEVSKVVAQPRKRAVSPLLSLLKLTDGFTKPSKAATVTKENKRVAALNLYDAFFPRDAHIVAYFLRGKHPELTKATVLECLRYTGVKENLRSRGLKDEQEAGKVPHEIRDGISDPIAKELSEKLDWGWPYYGAVDTTGKNIKAITYFASRRGGLAFLKQTYTGLDGGVHTVEDGLRTHINWLRKRLDLNADGVLECIWVNPKHHPNQTWADSTDAFHHADGSWPTHYPERSLGVASVELQAETYDALMDTADLYGKLLKLADGQRKVFLESEISDLHARATKLKNAVFASFWIADTVHFGGYFARGTDRDRKGRLRWLAIRSSDMGHLLNSRILDGTDPEVVTKREAVIKNLFSKELLCPSGIRTLSSDSLRYHPDKYHNGTTWPWVTYYIALGLKRHGYYGLAHELEKRILSLHAATKLLPEYASGSSNPAVRLVTKKIIIADETAPVTSYSVCQPAQEVQAWTAAAVLAIKQGAVSPAVAVDEQKRLFERHILSSIA